MKVCIYAILIMLTGGPVGAWNVEMFTTVLSENVHAGKVRYPELCRDPRFAETIAEISRENPESFGDRRQALAFWINAYNAWTLKAICDHYPVRSINELHRGGHVIGKLLKTTIWDSDFVRIHGEKTTLNHIEHDIVRKQFADPRAHFALVCASKSCPPLRSEAYAGGRLNEELNDQGKIFFADPTRNFFDAKNKIAHLSKILDWYQTDFGNTKEERLLFVARFLPENLAVSIRANPSEWKIDFLPYDWSLNE